MTEMIILGCVISLVLLMSGTIIWLARFSDRVLADIEKVKKNTEIQVNKSVPVIEYRESNIKDLVTKKTIPWDVYKQEPNEEIIDHVMGMIAKDLAELIVPFIDIREENDYMRNERVYHARIRVVDK